MNGRLALCCAPQFLIAFDFSTMTVAIASLVGDLAPPGDGAALVFAAYGLPFGSLLIAGGLLVDRIGPRRCLIAGLALFASGAVGAASAPAAVGVLAARALQGAGAALMVPAGLAITAAAFPAAEERRRALSWYAASISLGFVLGALAAGASTEALGWRAALGLPSVIAAIALARARTLRLGGARDRAGRTSGRRVTLATAAAISASCALCLVSSGEAPRAAVAAAALAALLALAAAAVGRFAPGPLMRDRHFRQIVAGGALVTATGVTGTLLLSLHLQDERGYAPTQTGAVFIGFGLVAFAGRRLAMVLRDARRVLATGLGLQGLALAALAAAVGGRPGWPALVALVAAFGLGHVIANAGVALGTAAVPAGFHGLAAATVAAAQYVSGALGPLVMPGSGSSAARLAWTAAAASLAGLALAMLTRRRSSLAARGTESPVVNWVDQ